MERILLWIPEEEDEEEEEGGENFPGVSVEDKGYEWPVPKRKLGCRRLKIIIAKDGEKGL